MNNWLFYFLDLTAQQGSLLMTLVLNHYAVTVGTITCCVRRRGSCVSLYLTLSHTYYNSPMPLGFLYCVCSSLHRTILSVSFQDPALVLLPDEDRKVRCCSRSLMTAFQHGSMADFPSMWSLVNASSSPSSDVSFQGERFLRNNRGRIGEILVCDHRNLLLAFHGLYAQEASGSDLFTFLWIHIHHGSTRRSNMFNVVCVQATRTCTFCWVNFRFFGDSCSFVHLARHVQGLQGYKEGK